MKTDNMVQAKSYTFALRIVKLYRYFCIEKKEFILSKQIVRSGTSIGANVEEAIGGQPRKDFLSKMGIAYKEARETHYWLRLCCINLNRKNVPIDRKSQNVFITR